MDTKSGDFFKNARRSGLWPDAEAVHRSTLTKARKKVPWQFFEQILFKSVDVAYNCWPQSPDYLWHGMSVYAFDGSKYNLPATDEIRKEFDPQSGLQYSGKGHYPQCLVSTAYDVFRRFPIARTVVGIKDGCEREEAKRMIPRIPSGNILLFDRGYPSYEFIHDLKTNYSGYFLFRCPGQSTFPAVEKFIKSKNGEAVIWVDPTNKYLMKISRKDRKKIKPIKLRIIKLHSPDGTLSVLLTNLFDKTEFPKHEIIALYFRRWEIESYYRDEKIFLEIEKFHSKTCNGIRQEMFAAVIMSVISRTLMMLSSHVFHSQVVEPQFKNSIMALASEAAVLVPADPEKAVNIFNEVLTEISRVKYYRSKSPRPSQLRVCKKPLNKWSVGKLKKALKKTASP